ncbi:MAG: hypothetical protein Q3971_09525 [Moraxella sp.]|nr:hypothetical protein [Moraxella sp.]
MNEIAENKYPTKKVIKNYMIFGTLIFNMPIFIYLLAVIIFRNDSMSIIIMMIALFFGMISSAIIFAMTAYLLSDLKITITKPTDYYKPFSVAFVVSLVMFFLMSFMVVSPLAGFFVSLVLAVFMGIISAVLAKFILPKS